MRTEILSDSKILFCLWYVTMVILVRLIFIWMGGYRWTCLSWSLSTLIQSNLLILIKLIKWSTLSQGLGNLRRLVLIQPTLTRWHLWLRIIRILRVLTLAKIRLSWSTCHTHSRAWLWIWSIFIGRISWLSIINKLVELFLSIFSILSFIASIISLGYSFWLYIFECIILISLIIYVWIYIFWNFVTIDIRQRCAAVFIKRI
jgi:hypothetical protein